MDADDLTGYLRAAFALDPAPPASLVPAGRGALGQVFRLAVGPRRYAVKQLFGDEPPLPARVAAEVEFTALAAAAGVRLAAGHPATGGRYAVPMPDGSGWLRLYDWLDGTRPEPGDRDLPAALGTLLGRLHRCAPATHREPDGAPPDAWFDVPPAADGWPGLLDAARAADAPWAPDLADRLALIRAVTALATPADPASMVTCHRDLHPENVLMTAGPDGDAPRLAVIDWDNLGPADPGGELVRVLLDWFFDHDTLDVDAARRALAAYRASGAPGRVTDGVFGFAIASRLNFLHRQVGTALDPTAHRRHRDWAVREIEEALRILPTPTVLARLVELDAEVPGTSRRRP
jgi:Ser/Thr protein kinase RdoA (MazF antagonist)